MARAYPQKITEKRTTTTTTTTTVQVAWKIKCAQCGTIKEVPYTRGKVPIFCSKACKQKAVRERAKAKS